MLRDGNSIDADANPKLADAHEGGHPPELNKSAQMPVKISPTLTSTKVFGSRPLPTAYLPRVLNRWLSPLPIDPCCPHRLCRASSHQTAVWHDAIFKFPGWSFSLVSFSALFGDPPPEPKPGGTSPRCSLLGRRSSPHWTTNDSGQQTHDLTT